MFKLKHLNQVKENIYIKSKKKNQTKKLANQKNQTPPQGGMKGKTPESYRNPKVIRTALN